MTVEESSSYTIVSVDDSKDQPTVADLKTLLETGSEESKIDTMKKILSIMLNGDSMPNLLMHVIRFIMPCKNKALKKLLYIYWEICPKFNADGKLKQEMVLVCNALRNDLLHPNEFIRGHALRYLCKLKEAEILEPLMPSVRACLDHRHPYVRKNALFAVFSIFKQQEILIPDAPELLFEFLSKETDASCKRNAFLGLVNIKTPLAVSYLATVAAQVPNFDELTQLAVIELIRKDCKNASADRAQYIQIVFSLIGVASSSVRYEAASTLVALTTHTSAIKAAAGAYIELARKESDNNVKLIVLDRIQELRTGHDRILDDTVMDILDIVSSPDLQVRQKALELALDMVSSRNVEQVIGFLKKELLKTMGGNYEKNTEYRQALIKSIHTCAIKFSEVADSVVHILLEFLTDSTSGSGVDVIAFVREVVEKFPKLREPIVSRLLDNFAEIKSGRIFRGVLWIIGEYAAEKNLIEESFKKILASLGPVPMVAAEEALLQQELENEVDSAEAKPEVKPSTQRRVLADGTYATESALSNVSASKPKVDTKRPGQGLRTLFMNGDFFVSAVLSSSLTKLALRYSKLEVAAASINTIKTQAMLIMTSLVRLGKSSFVAVPMDEDSYERISTCLRVLSKTPVDSTLEESFLKSCRSAYTALVKSRDDALKEKMNANKKINVHVDDGIELRFLKGKKSGPAGALDDLDLTRATGMGDKSDEYVSKLSRCVPLTGYSDPVYVEAYITVHQYDILLDMLIVNQTRDTLQNLTIEFSTLGDLKLVERPTTTTLGPHGFHTLKVNIKVASTETGVIFGNAVWDGGLDSHCVILNDIHLDIMDYIKPSTCNEQQFRQMWTEFEWENKVNVNSNITDLKQFLAHLLKSTNMNCLTPEHALSGDCGFLAANCYAKSIFGEDALANVCLEKSSGKIVGHVRIRSKTQGIALSLGDKITLSQKLAVVA